MGSARWHGAMAMACGLALATTLAAAPAQAAEMNLKNAPVNMMVQDKPLPDVLRELFASLGQPVVISDRIRGNVTGRFDTTADEFFRNLSSVFGLMSYYDGSVLYVSSAGEATSRVIPLRQIAPERFRRTLREMNVLDPRYELTLQPNERLVKVSGPPRYVEMVEEIAGKLDQASQRGAPAVRFPSAADSARPLMSDFRVFQLQYAWAQDTTMAVGGREVVVPGVATTLRRLVGNYSSGGSQSNGGVIGTAYSATGGNTLNRLRGTGMASQGAGLRGNGVDLSQSQPVDPQWLGLAPGESLGGMGMVNVSLPRVEADARTNAVIVHDVPERLGRYADLIAALDVRPRLIQIDATIVDVSTNSLSRLGVDFSQGSHNIVIGRGSDGADGQFRQGAVNLSGSLANSALNTSLGTAAGVAGAPLTGLTSVVGNMGRYFLAQVNLLAQEGQAYVHARPGVLTTSNTEAVLENTQTFFVRVAGERDVDLFNVTSGTILRVTPVLVDEGDRKQIKLAIRIEDGSITGQMVDQIPIIQRSTVGTQAMIAEGQSLLIGGYSYDVNRDLTSKVPLLGDIPALGALFTFRNREVSRVERMFMISPRIVEP